MAHWVVKDNKFFGCYYKCSECGSIFNDLRDNIGGTCPDCGTIMDEPKQNISQYKVRSNYGENRK